MKEKILKNREPYYWPISRIVEEYELISKSKSKLSSGQRSAVEHIYIQKAHKGILPAQKEAFKAQMEFAAACAEGLVRKLCVALKLPFIMSDFTLIIDEAEIGEIVNYMASYKGAFIGWIKIFLNGEIYNAKYYVEKQGKKEESAGVATLGNRPSGKEVARAIHDKDDNSKGKENL